MGENAMTKSFFFWLLASFFLTIPSVADAQNKATVPRIGVLYLGVPPNANFDVFIQELQELGHIDGKNILIEYRYAEGKEERLPELATELVRLKCDAIFTAGTPAFSLLSKQRKQSLSFSSALAIRLEPALLLVSRTQVVTLRACRPWLPTYGLSG